jgi:hypothetical protein
MKLLQHPDRDMLNVASSTLCNLLLEFSPAKDPILDAGAINILCQLTRHEDSGLRLNGVWALMVRFLCVYFYSLFIINQNVFSLNIRIYHSL